MRKIFTFLCAALMSVGMFAATEVTITQNDFPYPYGSSLTKDGVTVSGDIDGMEGSLMMGGSFSTTLGNFTKIEVTADDVSISGTGWTGNYGKMTWTGNASSVSFSGNIMGNGQGVTLKFTIEEPTVAVTGVTLNQNEAQMTVGGETLTLTATVNPNNATDQSVSWSTSDANVATVENGVVTAVAAGNATITVTTTDGSFTATCAVTVTAPEPQGDTITVTWNSYDLPSSGSGKSFTKDGVTITCTDGIDWIWKDFHGPGTFTTDLGNFTKIEVYAGWVTTPLGEGWSGNSERQTWTGNASSVSFSGEIMSAGEEVNLTFTIEEPEPEPEPDSETLETNTGNASYAGTHFSVTPNAGQAGDIKGFFVTYTDHATISALNGETILSVELTVGDGEEYISYFGASAGNVSHSGSLITISEVNATSVELLMTYISALQISQVKIYYEEKSEPTAIDEVGSQEPKAKSQKLIKNGQLLIERDGKIFNVQGVEVK